MIHTTRCFRCIFIFQIFFRSRHAVAGTSVFVPRTHIVHGFYKKIKKCRTPGQKKKKIKRIFLLKFTFVILFRVTICKTRVLTKQNESNKQEFVLFYFIGIPERSFSACSNEYTIITNENPMPIILFIFVHFLADWLVNTVNFVR